jgi:hypothetical protein
MTYMRKRTRWIWPIAVLAVPVVSWTVHAVRPAKRLDVAVVDKTVPFRNYLEHRSLLWAMRHLGIVRPDGQPYETASDYLGAFPPPTPGDPPERTVDLSTERARSADLVYLADTYGVYRDDLASKGEMTAALERSPKVYGGLEPREADAVEEALRSGKTVVAEFNTLGSPTSAAARTTLEGILGVRWTRWRGRFFSALEDEAEVPRWMRRIYEEEWKLPWEFRGPGYVLVEEDSRCEVLRIGEESERIGLVLDRSASSDSLLAEAADRVPYPYWFDVVAEAPGTERIASFRWRLTAKGSERLRSRGLPEVFPAVTRRRSESGASAYYFAGDFADNPMPDHAVPFAGYATILRWIHGAALAPSEMSFYWRFYFPMMERLLGELPARSG